MNPAAGPLPRPRLPGRCFRAWGLASCAAGGMWLAKAEMTLVQRVGDSSMYHPSVVPSGDGGRIQRQHRSLRLLEARASSWSLKRSPNNVGASSNADVPIPAVVDPGGGALHGFWGTQGALAVPRAAKRGYFVSVIPYPL